MAYHSSIALTQNYTKLASRAAVLASWNLINPGKFTCFVKNGFDYDSFNPRVQPTVWSVLRYFELSRVLGFFSGPDKNGNSFLDLTKLDRMYYIVSLSASMEKSLYDKNLDKHPMEMENEVVHIGNTSMKLRAKLQLGQIPNPSAHMDLQFVFVDPSTRRPSSPAAWWHEKYAQFNQPGETRLTFTPFKFDDQGNASTTKHQDKFCVRSSDVDPYCHVNHTSFVRFCYEAYVAHHLREFGYTGQGDPFRNVKKVMCVYKGEAGVGDGLTVDFVPDDTNINTYHFQIMKDSSKAVIFECMLEFYPAVVAESKV